MSPGSKRARSDGGASAASSPAAPLLHVFEGSTFSEFHDGECSIFERRVGQFKRVGAADGVATGAQVVAGRPVEDG